MNDRLIKIEHVYAGYDRQAVLQDVCLDIFEQDFLGVIGPNGGGKTTLLKVILGLLKPLKGEIIFLRPEIKHRIGYMPQTNSIDKKFPILVSEVIESGLITKEKASKKEQHTRIAEVMDQMGIGPIARKPIGELSGGQLQRTLLARAIVNNPELLILDEPNSYVDKRFETHFYSLLQEINKNTAIVLVSHDIGTVLSTVKNIACVNEQLHYHPGSDIKEGWLEEHFGCPFDIIGHGNIPHRILKTHE